MIDNFLSLTDYIVVRAQKGRSKSLTLYNIILVKTMVCIDFHRCFFRENASESNC